MEWEQIAALSMESKTKPALICRDPGLLDDDANDELASDAGPAVNMKQP